MPMPESETIKNVRGKMKLKNWIQIIISSTSLVFATESFGLLTEEQVEKDAVVEFNKSARAPCIPNYPCFSISNQYPVSMPSESPLPWAGINYRSEPEKYLNAVLQYVVEGNLEVDWNVAQNKARKWYHAPWMHGFREPVRGLTSERGSRWRELGGNQTRRADNWAVGFYNPAGGYTIGQVWKNKAQPASLLAKFPVGTVTAKLLFTDATDEEAPFISHGSNLAWHADTKNDGKPRRLRLLQLDVAVKEPGTEEFSGWVFGTFVFDGSQNKTNYWENLVPVGLEWGTSPSFTYADFRQGKLPPEGWVNPIMKSLFNRAPESTMGYLGRMNGPVDNPLSSCLSCHSRALDAVDGMGPPFTPPDAALCIERVRVAENETYRRVSNCTVDDKTISRWYRNLKSEEPFDPNTISLDYSLQLALGIANWRAWAQAATAPTASKALPLNTLMMPLKKSVGKTPSRVPAQEAFRRGD